MIIIMKSLFSEDNILSTKTNLKFTHYLLTFCLYSIYIKKHKRCVKFYLTAKHYLSRDRDDIVITFQTYLVHKPDQISTKHLEEQIKITVDNTCTSS